MPANDWLKRRKPRVMTRFRESSSCPPAPGCARRAAADREHGVRAEGGGGGVERELRVGDRVGAALELHADLARPRQERGRRLSGERRIGRSAPRRLMPAAGAKQDDNPRTRGDAGHAHEVPLDGGFWLEAEVPSLRSTRMGAPPSIVNASCPGHLATTRHGILRSGRWRVASVTRRSTMPGTRAAIPRANCESASAGKTPTWGSVQLPSNAESFAHASTGRMATATSAQTSALHRRVGVGIGAASEVLRDGRGEQHSPQSGGRWRARPPPRQGAGNAGFRAWPPSAFSGNPGNTRALATERVNVAPHPHPRRPRSVSYLSLPTI